MAGPVPSNAASLVAACGLRADSVITAACAPSSSLSRPCDEAADPGDRRRVAQPRGRRHARGLAADPLKAAGMSPRGTWSRCCGCSVSWSPRPMTDSCALSLSWPQATRHGGSATSADKARRRDMTAHLAGEQLSRPGRGRPRVLERRFPGQDVDVAEFARVQPRRAAHRPLGTSELPSDVRGRVPGAEGSHELLAALLGDDAAASAAAAAKLAADPNRARPATAPGSRLACAAVGERRCHSLGPEAAGPGRQREQRGETARSYQEEARADRGRLANAESRGQVRPVASVTPPSAIATRR